MVDDAIGEVAAFGEYTTYGAELTLSWRLPNKTIFMGLLSGQHVVVFLLSGILRCKFGSSHEAGSDVVPVT